MILLHSDCLVFETTSGESIPCSAEQVTLELIGEAARELDPDLIRQAAVAVLHYFRNDQGRDSVTVSEFTMALVKVLRGFGLSVTWDEPPSPLPQIAETDLRKLAFESGKGFELAFFQRLRQELNEKLRRNPRVVWFKGLRGCVKQLVGARRWSSRCDTLNDQIVEFLRRGVAHQGASNPCGLLVS